MNKLNLYLIFVLACGALLVLYFFNPVDYVWMPKCPTKMLLGINCPGCGFQRAAHAFVHGHIKEAIGYNLFFVVAFPYLAAILISGMLREGKLRQKLKKVLESKWMASGYIALFFIWFVIRNIVNI